MAAGDVGPGAHLLPARQPAAPDTADPDGPADWPDPADPEEPVRPVVFGNGFVLSPYAETGGPGGNLKHPPRTLWHASPGSTATPR
jgi:hypothetical protein